ncbi:PucR family transcriptional regulator [Actinoplanes sp. KI2]|uniref:PucR family transcriptional regulator n=1 Tax=Actinoplanes sp. KI2 TaxID=2983315 RepID=UPI0021D5A5CC|nr:PucR family transcriptional regulator [Actinoplanes sp. KI2]MCU7722252.1 PucR family transcriptional regulator [Actinoplanes sp. KI2]
MPVTAEELLAMPALGLRLVTGDPAATIRWAHSVELLDPTPWLAGGELVLTTGLRLPRSAEGRRQYVDRLADANVTGLGFGVGLGHDRIPPAVGRQCAARGLLLIEVPLPTPFLAISEAVADLLAQQAGAAVRRTLEHQQRMARAALNAGVAGIVRSLARALDAEVVVTDAHHLILAASPGDGGALLTRATAELGAEARSGSPLGLSVSAGDEHLMVQSLGVGGTRQGLLAVATHRHPQHPDQLLLTHAASLLSLELERPRELVEAHRGLRSAVLGVLLDGDLPAEVAHRPLRFFGFAPTDRLVVLLAQSSSPDRTTTAAGSATSPESPRPTAAQRVEHRLEDLDGRPYLLTGRAEGVVVVVRADDQDSVVAALEAADVTLGVSGVTTAGGLAAALRTAVQAAADARSMRRRVARFGDQRLPALLAQEAVRSAVGHLADDLLAPLAAHPLLCRSLDVFLQHNGVWETASRALGVHRHTLRHRMARVAELTGLDLESAQDRAALLLALLARKLYGLDHSAAGMS